MASSIDASTSGAGGVITTADNTGILNLKTAGTNAVTIDASQNVGIGTTSPTQVLTVNGRLAFSNLFAASNIDGIFLQSGVGTTVNTATGNNITFNTGTTERMRIDSSGHVYVGTTTFVPGEGNTATGVMIANTGKGFFSNGSDSAINANRNNDGGLIICRRSGNSVGSISVTSSATAYNTSSDYRLKENIAPMIGALDTVAQLKPVTYKWKIDGSDGQGFIAHELQEVVPDCVTGEKDAVDEEGNPVHQGVDTSFLVATLTAAIQEQQTLIVSQSDLINSLTARVTALEAK